MTGYKSSQLIARPSAPPASISQSLLAVTADNSKPNHNTYNPSLAAHTESKWWSSTFGMRSISAPYTQATKAKVSNSRIYHAYIETKSRAAVTSVTLSPKSPHAIPALAAAAGPRVLLYTSGPKSSLVRSLKVLNLNLDNVAQDKAKGVEVAPDRSYSSGGPIYSTAFRHDGRLLATGGYGGVITVQDANSRATLRKFIAGGSKNSREKVKGGSVRVVKWMRDGKRIVSGGDDGVVRVWELESNHSHKPKVALVGHGDAVRDLLILQNPSEGGTRIVSGGYDHTVRVWDVKDGSCLSVMDHGAPIEALVSLPNPTRIVSAGGTHLKVWNPVTGALLHESTPHSKTITSLCLALHCGPNTKQAKQATYRILTGGLDGLVKIYDPVSYTPLHATKHPSPVTALSCAPDGKTLLIGTSTGLLSIRHAPPPVAPKPKVAPMGGTMAHFERGRDAGVSQMDDFELVQQTRKRLKPFDVALRKFCYGEALDKVLTTKKPDAVSAVLEELVKRQGLLIALSSRDEETLEPILSFTARYIIHPQYSHLLIQVSHIVCKVYGGVIGQSASIDELLDKLRQYVKEEILLQKRFLGLMGKIDAIVNAASI